MLKPLCALFQSFCAINFKKGTVLSAGRTPSEPFVQTCSKIKKREMKLEFEFR